MIEIRQGKTSDLGLIVDFQVKMALETEGLSLDGDTVTKGVRAILEDSTKGTYYVAKEDGRVVGMLLTIPEWSDWWNGKVLWIHSLYIVPEAREKGIFKSLYRHLKNMVEDSAGLVGLRLYVDKNNSKAQKVYEKLGMNKDHYLLYEWMK